MKNYNRYQVYPTVNLKDRTWPNQKITKEIGRAHV